MVIVVVNVKVEFDSKKVMFLKTDDKVIIIKGDLCYLFITTPTTDLTLPLKEFNVISILGQDLRVIYKYGEKLIQGNVDYIITCNEKCCKRYLVTTDSIDLVDDSCYKKKSSYNEDEWYDHWFFPWL